jgi:hypothetical protein
MKTLMCQAFTGNVDKLSMHDGDPGTTGAHDTGVTHASLVWSAPSGGVSTATGSFTGLVVAATHIGLWEGSTFRQGIACPINYTVATDIDILVSHQVDEDS